MSLYDLWRGFLRLLGIATVADVEERGAGLAALEETIEEMTRKQTQSDSDIAVQKARLTRVETTVRALKAQSGVQIVPRRHTGAAQNHGKREPG